MSRSDSGTEKRSLGPHSLLTIVQSSLIRIKAHLGDVGAVPYQLLEPVLEACSPEELANIEDGTRGGIMKRSLTCLTWPLWYQHCRTTPLVRLTSCPDAKRFPLPGEGKEKQIARSIAQEKGIEMADWRSVYDAMVRQVEAKRDASVQRAKAAFGSQKQQQAQRVPQVIAPIPKRRRNSNGFDPSSKHKVPSGPKMGVKERLVKKLGLSGHGRTSVLPQKSKHIVSKNFGKPKPAVFALGSRRLSYPKHKNLIGLKGRRTPSKEASCSAPAQLIESDMFSDR